MRNECIFNEEMDDNIIDENNNYDYGCEAFNHSSQFEEYDECEPENNIENEFNRDNQIILKDQENMVLKKKLEEMQQLLFQKDKELEENKIKNDNQLIKINKTFDKHINEYQKLVKNYVNIQNELKNAKKEINNKNQIINNLKNNDNFNNNELENPNLILLLNQKLRHMSQQSLEGKINLFNENEYLNKDINSQIQILMKNIDILTRELISYKNNKINEILKLRNILNNSNNSDNYNFAQFYLEFINLINNFCNNISNDLENFNNLPNYSLKDNNDKKFNDILITIKTLTDYIISFQNNQNDLIPNTSSNNMNNKYNEELNQRLREMSELLIKTSEYLNKSRQENNEIKQKYNELEKRYNSTIKDISSIDYKDKNYDKLINEINNKNKQIKSLEHMITRLTNKSNINNTYNNNLTSKSMLNDSSYYGKIINKKLYNEIKNNQNQNSFYLNNNTFIKDEKNEANLKLFLNKFTNGEYNNMNKKNINKKVKNNSNVINIKDEIEKLNKGINAFSDDEIENEENYNEEEEERKYQMEGKISN